MKTREEKKTKWKEYKKRYENNPVLFSKEMLYFIPDEWQSECMMSVVNNRRTSVRSGQGVGKTGLEAVLVIWFLLFKKNPRVICTAPTMQQLYTVLWAEIAKWLNKSKVKKLLQWHKTTVYLKGHGDTCFAVARTATKPENMQGFHEDNMLFIVDEASGVADPIMEAILGTLSGDGNKLLMCGNPNNLSGVFYDSHNKDRADYNVMKVSSLDSKRTSKENIAMLKRKYHENSDVYRVRVLGEFPKAEADTFIPLEFAELAAETRLAEIKGDILHIGADIARFGDDETVIASRIGNKVFDLNCYSKQDTMVTAGWIINIGKTMMEQYPHVKEVRVKVDDSGVGGGVTDRLNEVVSEEDLPFTIIPVNNGSTSEDEHYENKGTEAWAVVRDALEENFSDHIQGKESLIELPQDDRLISQLTTRKYKMTSRGRIALEKKEDMKKRGLSSPDRADAVVLSFLEDGNTFMEYLKSEYENMQNQGPARQFPTMRG